jgi:beta-phosphoglucomutase-like phosphatase (HAD superfamily)
VELQLITIESDSNFLTEVKNYVVKNDIKYFLFDIDGTLVNSMIEHDKAWKKAFDFFQIEFNIEELGKYKGWTSVQIVEYLNQTKKLNIPIELAEYKERYYTESHSVRQTVGLEQGLSVLRWAFKNKFRIVACTGGTRLNVVSDLKNLSVDNCFEKFFTADDQKNVKVDKQYWIDVAKEMAFTPINKCLVLEDAKPCAEAAISAGMHALLV